MAKEGQAFKENIYTTRWSKKRISEDDKGFKDALMEKGINAKLDMQAANSPDVNLLDLRVFRAFESFNDTTPKVQRGIDSSSQYSIQKLSAEQD